MIAIRLLITLLACLSLPVISAKPISLISTESDPDAFIQDMVNVINGDYCETAIDLLIAGPDPLILQRFYNTKDSMMDGRWKIFPQRFLVIGKDFSGKSCIIGKDRFEWTLALTGERSGGTLPYSGWRNANGTTKDPLKIDTLNQAVGMVNTYAKEINGQTNHQNNQLHCRGDICELILGDGTKRIYKQVKKLPSRLLGEETTPSMAAYVVEPAYFLLTQEILPSGNQIFFSYDKKGHLSVVEMKNSTSSKMLSWIHLFYTFGEKECQVHIQTSDARELEYNLVLNQGSYHLTHVSGSHCIPTTYEYNDDLLVKKVLPEGHFIEIAYQDGKVKSLKGANAHSGCAEIVRSFSYGKNYTDVFDIMNNKTRYVYDNRFQLTAIERYDEQDKLYRIEQKFWGKTKIDAGLILVKTIGDGAGRIYSYRTFQYDKSGNVIEEKLYGNLTGKQEVSLQISSDGKLLNPDEEECHLKMFSYSTDGFNLLTKVGDCKGNHTLYSYKTGTNFLIKKLIYDKGIIKKRTFQSYNADGVCTKIIEDDGSDDKESDLYRVTERHIQAIKPKKYLPGVGLPEVIEEKALDLKIKQEVLIKKFVNTYDNHSHHLSCDTYDSNDQYAFTERKTYNSIGQVTSQRDAIGREIFYTYDEIGNQISSFIPHQNKQINTTYDFRDNPIKITEVNAEEQFSVYNTYDIHSRKISSTDRFGNATNYEYDAFHRLTKVVYPEVLDERGQIIHPIFQYTYDIFGNVLSSIDPKGFIITKSYNLRGDPTRISYPDGSFEFFKYDTEGSLHRSLSREQIITIYEYDYLGRSIYEESSSAGESGVSSYLFNRYFQYNGFRCTYEKNDDHVKRFAFDLAGRLSSITELGSWENEKSPNVRLTELIYDSLSRIHQRKVWFDVGSQDYSLECLKYDLAGNITQKRIEDGQGNILLQRFYRYSLQNQCTEEYFFEDRNKITLVRTTYNSQGEPIGYIDALGQETKIIINTHQNSIGQTVLKKTIINPIGMETEMEFDPLARIVSLSKKNPLGILLFSQKIFYDPLGNKTCEIHNRIVDGKIIDSQKMQWIYGPMGRLDVELHAAETSFAKQIYYEYNSLGKLISKKISGNESPILYTYNKDGNLYKIEYSTKELQISNRYSYDRKGNILTAYSLDGKSIQRTYSHFNQVTKETIRDGEGMYTLEFAYDRKGRLKEITLPDRSKIAYTYDALFGREVKRISSRGETLYTHTYDTYDNQGKLLSENHIGNGGPHQYKYNRNGQKIASKSDFINQDYTRDIFGRLIEIKGKQPQEFTYNDLSQLTSEKKLTTQTYFYDSLDNRIKNDNEELIYNSLNQLIFHSHTQFSYDSQGNLLRKVLDGEETRFESNILSQLISVEKADQTALNFSYDPFGRQLVEKHFDIKNKKNLSTTRYLYLGYQEIGTLSQAGTIETLKVLGLQGDDLAPTSIAFEIKGETYVPIHDIASNVICLIDPQSRQIVESYEYTAFKEKSIFNVEGNYEEISPIGNPWRFAEKRIDEKSGLIFFGLRFYDPTIGRWVSQDPAGTLDGPNLYAYLHNNPLNYLDYFGLSSEANSQNKFEEYFYGEVESHCYCEKHRCCKRGGDIGKTVQSSLPLISYCECFEKKYPNYERSRTFDLSTERLPELPENLGIGFINGVWNTSSMARESVKYISKLSGGYNIHAVYNATHGTCVDLKECKLGLNFIATDPVRQLHQMWDSFFEKSSANAKFLMICHSQGAIHVRNGLIDYPPEFRERILVVAIAPGAYIYRKTCAKVIHYRAEWWRDFIPILDGAGAKREKDTIVTLDSRPKASFFDHEFLSPTYQEILQRNISNYLYTKGKQI